MSCTTCGEFDERIREIFRQAGEVVERLAREIEEERTLTPLALQERRTEGVSVR